MPKLLIAIALLIALAQAAIAGTSYEPPVEGGPATSQASGTR